MTHWIERIDQTTGGVILAEHMARYELVRPIVAGAKAWADLGCGTSVASTAALAGAIPDAVLIVDADEESLAESGQRLGAHNPHAVRADLASDSGISAVAGALDALGQGPRAITCFEVVEHLSSFTPLLGWLIEQSERADATVVLSVPNDVHSGVENPYHLTKWGDGSVAELRALLPAGHVAAEQVPLSGSGIAIGGRARVDVPVELGTRDVPSHFIFAFGPRADQLATVANAQEIDLDAWRTWEIQREAELAYLHRVVNGEAEK
jgi:hypothetical protein